MTLTGSGAAELLRSRATSLRSLAQRLHALQVIDCYRVAGVETWIGPSPQGCAEALRGFRAKLQAEGDALTVHARRLDRLADEVEQRALLMGPH